MNIFENDKKLIYKLIFIYNALVEGWKIKMVQIDKFEFTKTKTQTKKVDLTDKNLEKEFIKRNSDLKNFIKNIKNIK